MKIMKIAKALYAGAMTGIAGSSAAYVAGHGHIGLVAALTVSGYVITAVAVVFGVANATDEPPAAE